MTLYLVNGQEQGAEAHPYTRPTADYAEAKAECAELQAANPDVMFWIEDTGGNRYCPEGTDEP